MTEIAGVKSSEGQLPSQRVEYKNSRGLTVVGDFYSASSKSIVIMSHGLGVDRHESDGKFDVAAQVLRDAGFNVLKFDFSGQGESPMEKPDTVITPEQNRDDLASSIKYVRERGFKHIGLLGCSFGGYISCQVYNPRDVQALLLWAPVSNRALSPEDYYLSSNGRNDPNNKENLEKMGFAIRQNARAVGSIKVGREVFQEWRKIDQKDLLSRIECPTLIIQEEGDPRIPAEDSRNALNYLPQGSSLKMMEGDNHPFGGEEIHEVSKASAEWFIDHLPR